MLSPAQEVFMRLSLNSVSFRARLLVEGVAIFSSCLALFRLGKTVRFSLCLWLLGLMESAILVDCLGRLHMREFHFWVAACRVDSVCHGALCHQRALSFLTEGGIVLSRMVVTTDASLIDWGGVHDKRIVRNFSVFSHKFSGSFSSVSVTGSTFFLS